MKRILSYLGVLLFTYGLFPVSVSAQAPSISYNPINSVFTVNVAITPLAPANSGGAVPATTYSTVSTFVGAGAGLNNPRGLALDGTGNIFETDFNTDVINEINSTGTTITLISGKSGTSGEKNGANANSSRFNGPWGVAYDGAGNLYVSDNTGNAIRKVVVASGMSTTLAGPTTGVAGEADGTGATASFTNPAGIVYDGLTYLYVCDNGGNKIRRIAVATGAVLTIAGSGAATETDNTTGTSATFNGPSGIVYDGAGNLYVSDVGGNTIRKISTTAPFAVTTFAGTAGTSGSANGTGIAATFNAPYGLTKDASGNIIVADEGNNLVRIITPAAVVTTLAGNGTKAELNGVGTAAEFFSPYSVAADNAGNLFTGDNNAANSTCRKILLTGYTINPAVLPATLSFAGTTGTISGTPNAVFAATNFTITGYNASGSSAIIISLACGQNVNWTSGSNTTAWSTPGNWSTAAVPLPADKVFIGVIAYTNANEPSITSSTSVNSITFGSVHPAGTLTMGAGATLTIGGGITVNTGSSPTISGAGAVTMAPKSVVTLSGTGTLTLSSPLTFTLQSDATGDASVAAIPATANLSGTVTVQRYITGGSLTYRGYRLLTSPVTSGSGDFTINYLKGSIYITATTTTGGFDNVVPANPSIYLYRENLTNPSNSTFTGSNFRGINNILTSPVYGMDDATYPTTNIPIGNGFLCFFRGNSGATSFANETKVTYVPQTVTLSTSGTLNIGNVVVKDWFTPGSSLLSVTPASPFAGYSLVGNPYASSIDWDTYQTTSLATGGIYVTAVSKIIYELDPISHNFGAYISGFGGAGGTNNATNIIASGQGFFITATNAATSQLTFTETAKTSTQKTGASLLMGTPVNLASNQYLKLRLAKDTANADETVIRFNNQASTNYNPDLDAPYKPGYGAVSLAGISKDNIKVAIHAMPLPKLQAESLALNVSANTTGIYTLSLKDIVAVPRLYDVWLMDKYMKDSLDMRQNLTYSFNIYTNDTASFGANRFMLTIRPNPAYAYQLLSFDASKVPDAKQVQINWSTANEGNYTNFTVEHSIDEGKTYSVLGSLTATGAGDYGLLDKSPAEGRNLYRLKQEDINNTITYSNVVAIQFSYQSNSLTSNNLMIYPNPVVNTINLSVTNQTADNAAYDISFMNSSGVVVKQVTSAQSTWQGNISGFLTGTYLIQVTDKKDNRVVGQTKFVKL